MIKSMALDARQLEPRVRVPVGLQQRDDVARVGQDRRGRSWTRPLGPSMGQQLESSLWSKDPYEAHPYLFSNGSFDLQKLNDFHAGTAVPAHASIINEYAWLWLWSDEPLCITQSRPTTPRRPTAPPTNGWSSAGI